MPKKIKVTGKPQRKIDPDWVGEQLGGERIKGGTRKIADLPKEAICRHPAHNPPSMQVFQPGVYEHTCPACGKVTRFVINHPPTL